MKDSPSKQRLKQALDAAERVNQQVTGTGANVVHAQLALLLLRQVNQELNLALTPPEIIAAMALDAGLHLGGLAQQLRKRSVPAGLAAVNAAKKMIADAEAARLEAVFKIVEQEHPNWKMDAIADEAADRVLGDKKKKPMTVKALKKRVALWHSRRK